MPPAATGLLIIRVWVEDGSAQPLRADIRISSDVRRGFQRELTVSDIDAVEGIVRGWLRDVDVGGRAPQADGEQAQVSTTRVDKH